MSYTPIPLPMNPDGTLDREKVTTIALEKLREQGEPSLNHRTDTCAYRGDGGTMCALGFFLPDDEAFNADRNAMPIYEIPTFAGLSTPDRIFLGQLQLRHDDASQANNFLKALFHDPEN